MLSARSFIVLHFTFRSRIHFESIFVKVIRFMSRCLVFFFFFLVLFLYVDVQLLQHHLLQRLSFFHCLAFAPLGLYNRQQQTMTSGPIQLPPIFVHKV